MGALEQLESSLSEREDLKRLMTIARRGMSRLLRISESLADAAELEGGVTITRARVDLADVAKRAAERARAFENRSGITLECRCEPAVLAVDAPRVARAVFELTSNALRSARKSVTVTTLVTPDAITIAVLDDGPGCGQPTPRFTPSVEQRGLGLGLALAADVATLHGGHLIVGRAPNADGEVTSVEIVFPRVLP